MTKERRNTSSPVVADSGVSLKRVRFITDTKDYDRMEDGEKDTSEWIPCKTKEEERQARAIAKELEVDVQIAIFSHEGKLLWEIPE